MVKRKPTSQQAASKASARKAPKQSRGAPAEQAPAPFQSRPREQHAAAQHTARASVNASKENGPAHAQTVHAAAVQTPDLLHASVDSMPQLPPHHEGPKSLQAQPHALPFSKQHEPLQATADVITVSHEAHDTPQDMPDLGHRAKTSTILQVCMLPGCFLLRTVEMSWPFRDTSCV